MPKKYSIISISPKETEAVGENLSRRIKSGDFVALFGQIGAGKTAFVRGFAKGLRFSGRVSSPTYSIVNEYTAKMRIYHFDLYRISTPDELYDIGWEDYICSENSICIAEWCENIKDFIPKNSILVHISVKDDNQRLIEIEIPDN